MNQLKSYFTEGTLKTPQVDFNNLTGELILFGRSIPENAAKVYEPLVLWTSYYINSPCQTTNFRLNLEYYNTASSIWIVRIIKELSKITLADSVLFIHIYFDMDDFESMDIEELKDIVFPMVKNVKESIVSIGIKTYGTNFDGKIVAGSTIII
jgi:hypothetical protein